MIKSKLLKNTTYLVLCIRALQWSMFEPEISLPRIVPKEINVQDVHTSILIATLFENCKGLQKETLNGQQQGIVNCT